MRIRHNLNAIVGLWITSDFVEIGFVLNVLVLPTDVGCPLWQAHTVWRSPPLLPTHGRGTAPGSDRWLMRAFGLSTIVVATRHSPPTFRPPPCFQLSGTPSTGTK
jgi:hypothetical protein